jgi:hypothetical protein
MTIVNDDNFARDDEDAFNYEKIKKQVQMLAKLSTV